MADGRGTIWVVDDDDAMRDSLAMLLRAAGHEVERCDSAQAFLDRWQPGSGGCAILDIRMPGMDGLELQRALQDMDAAMPVIFITGHGDVPMAVEAMQRGAAHFLQKPFGDEELLRALERVLATGSELEELRARKATLSPREVEVMDRVARGDANKVIAIDLGLSQRTVEIHRAHVMEKMDCRSLADLVRAVVRLDG